jgi:uncharacterized membrane protein
MNRYDPSAGDSAARSSSTTLRPNAAAAIACIPLIGGIIFYLVEKRDSFVRFYAMQSIIFGIAWILLTPAWLVLYIVSAICSALAHAIFGAIPTTGAILVLCWSIFAAIINLVLFLGWITSNGVFFILWIIVIVNAFNGVRWDIPYVGPIARKQVEGSAG